MFHSSGGFGFGGYNNPQGGFGGEGGFLTSQQETTDSTLRGNGGGKQSEELHMYPYTVALMKKSFQRDPLISHSDFFGEEVKHVFLVGLVRDLHIDESSEKWTFKLDDGTGSILVEWCVADTRKYDEPGPSQWTQRKLEQIKENVYVDVRGGINMLGKSEPAVRAYNVKRVAVPEEIFAHQVHIAQEIVRRICPQSQTQENNGTAATATSAGMATGAAFDRGSSSPQASAASRFAQTTSYDSGKRLSFGLRDQQPQQQSFNSGQASPFSFYDPMAANQQSDRGQQDGNSEASQAIVTFLKNLSTIKPQGLTEDEILMNLLGRGIGIDAAGVQRECRALVNRSLVYEGEKGKWKLTNF